MTTRTRVFKGKIIPSATTTQVHICGDPECDHVHLIGMDDDGKPLCEIVIGDELFIGIKSMMERH